jgi:hypothetical protein
VLYGLPAAPTAAAVVLYHAIALWVPTIAGTGNFVALRRSLALRAPQLKAVVGGGRSESRPSGHGELAA